MIVKAVKHFCTVTKHRLIVFYLCSRCGLFWRGLVHDLSKYSPIEFFEGVKYYQGVKSPIALCKKINGYSKAWLNHTGRNKHHHEYWYDYYTPDKTPVIPYKYVVEMICDNLAAGIVYNGKNWKRDTQYNYWLERKDKIFINEKVNEMLLAVFKQVSKDGIKKTITRTNLKKQYIKYCGEIK